MKKYFLFIISFVTNFCFAQVPSIEWQKSLGGSNNDWGTSIQQTKDGGYIVGGYSMSFDEDVTGHHSSDDFWVARLNPSGDLIWQKSLGGTLDDNAYSIKETADKGFIIAGSTGCTDGDVTYNHGYSDYWVVKLDSSGNIQWQKTYGGSLYETALCIEQTKDLGFIISGHSDSNDGDVTNAHSGDDCWIVKTDSYGVIQWQKTYGGSNDDWAWSIQQTTDNGYIVAGASNSNNGDVTGHHGSVSYGDCWVFKTDSLGNLLWEKSIGGSFNEDFKSVQQTSDGGYILAGSTQSSDGDVTGFKGATDIWVAKLDANGNLVGKRTFGGSDSDQGYSVKQTNDKGFIVTGCTNSSDGDVTNKRGTASYSDYWVVKIDTMGAIEWENTYGGIENDVSYDIRQTADSGYVISGCSASVDGDVTNSKGGCDYWIVKLFSTNRTGLTYLKNETGIFAYPNPVSDILKIASQKELGTITIFNTLGEIVWNIKSKEKEESIDVGYFPSGVYTVYADGKYLKVIKE